MKALKISLVIIALATISVTAILSLSGKIKTPIKVEIDDSESYRKEIDTLIKQIEAKPDNRFCKDFYDIIVYKINDYYKPAPPKHPFGRFGKTQTENDNWKKIYEDKLYATYADKFIKQAKSVLNDSEWNPTKLRFIRSEANKLKNSTLSEPGNPRNNEFNMITTALDKYDEIVTFISTCRDFSNSHTGLDAKFQISDVQNKIKHAERLRSNNLENHYVNNCTRLHNELKEIPQILFQAHVRYLESKINDKAEWYKTCISQKEYANLIYQPLNSEIDALESDIYKVSNFNSEKNRLTRMLNDNSAEATRYFNNKTKNGGSI